jgi:Holliday junction resolvase-like predicted endonuclease
VHGYVSNLWYGALRSRYPYDFILYAKKYNKTSEGYKDLLAIAAERVNKLYAAMNSYLIDPPNTEEQKVEFDRIIVVFEKLLHKQNAEN